MRVCVCVHSYIHRLHVYSVSESHQTYRFAVFEEYQYRNISIPVNILMSLVSVIDICINICNKIVFFVRA